jgi:membrane-associated protease RseP (regulator of RpoE activity)
MKLSRLFIACCVAAAVSTASTFAQDEPVEVRVRAVAGPNGKLEVVEERIVGSEKVPENKTEKKVVEADKEADKKDEDQPLRGRLFRHLQGFGEKLGGAKTAEEEVVTEGPWGEMPQSDYWIGVQIGPIAPEIRKHLPVKHGVLVVHVYPDSPAIKAELKADDILLQAGDVKIETGPDLVKAVDGAKETELSFIVLREGKEQKLNVTPIKREEGSLRLSLTRTAAAPRIEKLQAAQRQFELALETLRAETQQEGALDFMLVRPGAFMIFGEEAKIPDDLTVQITKEGNKPAKVHVKKGDKSWDTTGDKLDVLPEELRPHVEQMLNGSGSETQGVFSPATSQKLGIKVAPPASGAIIAKVPHPPRVATVPALPAVPAVPGTPAAGPMVARAATLWSHAIPPHASDAKLDQILKKLDAIAGPDLEDMKKELKSLRKEVDELRKKSVDR